MAETGCATCDGRPSDCAHCWHSRFYQDRAFHACCRCPAFAECVRALPHDRPPVPEYRDEWATPPSATFRRTDGGMD